MRSFSLFVGLRYIFVRRNQQMVSFLSGLSIVGLVVGVALLVLVLSVVNGFERELQNKILGLIPQAVIRHYQGLENWQDLQALVEKNEEIVAAAPFIQKQALIGQGREAVPAVLIGMDLHAERRVSHIESLLNEKQRTAFLTSTAPLILGADLAAKLELQEGARVMLVVPNASDAQAAPQLAYFEVVASLKTATELDSSLAISSIEALQIFMPQANTVSGLRLKVKDIFSAQRTVYRQLVELGPGYFGDSWLRTHGNISYSIKTSKRLVGLLMSLIVAIALFNVVSSLVMVVLEKRGDIAILRTLGASTKKIMGIFIVQGCAIGFVGTVVGIILGCVLSLGLKDIVIWVEGVSGLQFLKSDVYPVTYLPAEIRPTDLLLVGLIALSMSFFATLYPAWRAARTPPAEALRYE